MSWSLEDGTHAGWVEIVLNNYRTISSVKEGDALTAIGWFARCECGWSDPWVIDRADHPSPDGLPEEQVEKRCLESWETHVAPARALSRVAAAEEARADAAAALDVAVSRARNLGQSWEAIGRAVGITRQSAHERWSAAE